MNLVVRIDTLGHRGVGIGRHQGKVVMVPLSAPGDMLEVQVSRTHRTYEEAKIARILEPSPHRRRPPCPYFGTCGGCQLQHLDLSFQRLQKDRIFRQMLTFRGHVEEERILGILAGPSEFGYRCRIDLQVVWEGSPRVGFARAGSSKVIPIHGCMLAMESLQSLLPEVEGLLKRARPTPVSRLEIACDAPGEGRSLFLSIVGALPGAARERLARMAHEVPGLRSLCLGKTTGGAVETIWRSKEPWQGVLVDLGLPNLEGQCLEVWPGVFSQVNPEVNRLLVTTLCSWVQEIRPRRILDLFAGMGNLSIPLAALIPEVVAVELDPRAVANGMANSRRIGVQDLSWTQAPAARALSRMVSSGERFDVVVMDPPRCGAKELLEPLGRLRPKAIFYVSCDPATLSRDLGHLHRQLGYRVERVQPLDMFPQTFHLESLSLLVDPAQTG